MSSFPDLYPARDRPTNVSIIKNLLSAQNEKEYDEAYKRMDEGLHPSLFAELDWREMNMPVQQREEGAHFSDDMFIYHLPAILSLRKIEFDIPDEELRWDILENINFYKNLEQDEAQPLNSLGDSLKEKVHNFLQDIEPDEKGAISRRYHLERPRIFALLSGMEDPNWILLMIDVEIKNALARSLDHVTSRIQTKHFLRHIGGNFPRIKTPTIKSNKDLQFLYSELGELEKVAQKYRVYQLVAVCKVLSEFFHKAEVSDFDNFSGELATGYGHCNRCSMMFSSSAIVSFDSRCPELFRAEDDIIYLPAHLNTSLCPFCGEEARIDTPSMFFSEKRNLVIYNFPQLGQFTKEEARETYRPVIESIRRRYISCINYDEVAKFNAANEELTYSITEFLVAIQMGTTVKEEHVYNVVGFPDGSGVITDVTKGAIIGLTRTEMMSEWATALAKDSVAASKNESERYPLMEKAMEAFTAKQYTRSRDILLKLLEDNPGDEYIQKNLASIYVTLGDKESAREILKG